LDPAGAPGGSKSIAGRISAQLLTQFIAAQVLFQVRGITNMSALDDAQFPLEPAEEEKLLNGQKECTFIWNTREGWPVGTVMGYLWRDGKIWLTCGGGRPRVRAVKRSDRVCVVVSEQRPNNADVAITIKGRCRVHHDTQTKQWFFDKLTRSALPDNEPARQGMLKMLDSPDRVVLCVTPEKSFSYDGAKMVRAVASVVTQK
jgi:general stress protein 26